MGNSTALIGNGGPHRPLGDTLANFPESSEDLIEISAPLWAHLSLVASQVGKVEYRVLRLATLPWSKMCECARRVLKRRSLEGKKVLPPGPQIFY